MATASCARCVVVNARGVASGRRRSTCCHKSFRPKRPPSREGGPGVPGSESLTDLTTMTDQTASVAEANAARLPLGYRDSCSAYVFVHT